MFLAMFIVQFVSSCTISFNRDLEIRMRVSELKGFYDKQAKEHLKPGQHNPYLKKLREDIETLLKSPYFAEIPNSTRKKIEWESDKLMRCMCSECAVGQ